MSNGISKPASQRLIKLVSLLEQLEEEAKVSKKDDIPKTVTSSLIEHRTGWTRDTIRRDISLLGVQCGSSSGYNIQELKEAIKSKLFVSPSVVFILKLKDVFKSLRILPDTGSMLPCVFVSVLSIATADGTDEYNVCTAVASAKAFGVLNNTLITNIKLFSKFSFFISLITLLISFHLIRHHLQLQDLRQ